MSNESPQGPVEEFGQRPDDHGIWRTGPIWMASDRRLAKYVGRPIAGFLQVEAAGGIILLLAAVLAMVWANSPWAGSYEALWQTEVSLNFGGFELSEDLRHWVNDALMVIFFFVVGLEIKYEIVAGELRDPKAASVPIIAAFGGMAVPALIYAAFNAGGEGAAGWGIPMATDIAFAVGVLGLLGRRIPSPARVFLLTLAIVDDIGAIVVIAVFYTSDLSLTWLGMAGLLLLLMVGLRVLRVWSMSLYVMLGIGVWFATYESGVHATIAGVVLGLLAPALPLLDQEQSKAYAREAIADEHLDANELRRFRFLLGESVPVAERLGAQLHPWSSYLVLPVFALANAGINLSGDALTDALSSPVTAGVALGLLVGKIVGVAGASWLAVLLGVGRLPHHTTWSMLIGLGAVAGIGFTVSLFITGLSFAEGSQLAADAKVGILGASLVAALLGSGILLATARDRQH
ncbi:MAG TPA: Na+/H+ antiporter NhaA [Nocardioidaceae bacterium]|nr:Na+/H+ antiporter NhaA [Nocardioidaceae bacterium]